MYHRPRYSKKLTSCINLTNHISQLKYSGWLKRRYIYNIIIPLVFLIITIPPVAKHLHAKESDRIPPVEILLETMEYLLGAQKDSIEKSKWQPISQLNPDQLPYHNEILIRFSFPEIKWQAPALLVTGYLNSLEAWQNQSRIYSAGKTADSSSDNNGNGAAALLRHIIILSPRIDDPGSIYLRVPYQNIHDIGFFEKVYIGELNDIITLSQLKERNGLRFHIPLICLGGILLFTGALFLGLFLFPLKEKNYPFISFGFFSLVAGISYLNINPVHAALGLSPKLCITIDTLLFFLLPVGIIAFVEYTFVSPLRPILRKLWQFQLLLTLIAGVWFQISIIPNYLYVFGDFISLTSIILSLASIYKSYHLPENSSSLSKTTMAGLIIFVVTAVIDIFNELGIISFGGYYFGFGTLILILVFGYALLIHYKATILAVDKYTLELEINRRKILMLEQANLKTRFEALKNQLNPHFLFNTLGTLMTLIEEDGNRALGYVEKLSRVYRYLLNIKDKGLVRLEEELEFINSYAGLVSGRFGSGFQFNIRIPSSYYNYCIPPLGLQLLLENALKHNTVLAKSPLKVDFFIESDNYITVRNNLQLKQAPADSHKLGLKNLEGQYSFFTDKKIIMESENSFFTVKIPLLKMEKKIHYDQAGENI